MAQAPQFSKNIDLVEPICKVEIESVHGSLFSNIEEVYTTLSSIRLNSRQSVSAGGFLCTNKITLNYPGVSSNLFSKLSSLVKGLFIVRVTTISGYLFEISNKNNPMRSKVNFNEDSTSIEFSNESFEKIKFIQKVSPDNPIGLATTLSFNLAS